MDVETALIITTTILFGILSAVIIIVFIKIINTPDKPEKIKVCNKLIVKDKKERICNKVTGRGFIDNGFGYSRVDTSIEVEHILVVYDTFTNKYDEVKVTVDTYYSTEIGEEITFDSEPFIHYEEFINTCN